VLKNEVNKDREEGLFPFIKENARFFVLSGPKRGDYLNGQLQN
jgi:hypothetical protein